MSSHSHGSELEKWTSVKAQLIRSFRTVTAAAVKASCHPNSFRLAATRGQCPRIIRWLREHNVTL